MPKFAMCVLAVCVGGCTTSDEPVTCSNDYDCPVGCACAQSEISEEPGECQSAEGVSCAAITCLGPGDCPDGMFCEDAIAPVTTCHRACLSVLVGDGSEGAACSLDSDCASGRCDNELAHSPCECAPMLDAGTLECPPVDVPIGSVPLEGACDEGADCADDVACHECACRPAVSEPSCDDPFEVRLEVVDAEPQCETVFEDAAGVYREIEVAQMSITVGYDATHATSQIRWDRQVRLLDAPEYEEAIVVRQELNLFPGTTSGIAVELTDTCDPPRVAEDVLAVRWDDALCP